MTFFTDRRMVQAVKVAVAAGAAWLIVLPWGGVADTYPYYAPLGAVTAVAGTVAGSARATLSSVGAIALGAVPAVLALALPVPEVFALVVVVLVGSWLSDSDRLGPMASWVPISGLFILIIGEDDPAAYVTAYVGLVAVGALVGLAVDLLWPALPLNATQSTLDSLRDTLAAQLEDLADGLCAEPLPTAEEWQERERAIDSRAGEMHRMVSVAREARRVNWRARRWRERAERQYRQARALTELSFRVEEAYDLVARGERAELAEDDEVALGPELRPAAVRALRATAEVLAAVEDESVDLRCWEAGQEATEAFAHEIRMRQYRTDAEFFAAGSLVTTLRRALNGVEPAERVSS